jgi:glutaconate CoA-transferase, subunit B
MDFTPSELMAVSGARELEDRQVVAVGLGLPVVASFLAKKTHAPNMTILFEIGVIDPEPVHCGVGLADPRVWYRAKSLSSFADILGTVLHRGRVDVGFLGGLEIDQYGNLNATLVGDPRGKFRHINGGGGANDIASSAQKTIFIMRQEERKFREKVSFITSPGYIKGGDSREKAGLRGGPSRVITDRAIFGFDPETKKMALISIHPGNTLEDVLATMGFRPLIPKQIPFTEPPTPEQLRLIREEIDPGRMYMG